MMAIRYMTSSLRAFGAIRIPVILILLGSAVVGSFLSVVMIRSNRKEGSQGQGGSCEEEVLR